MSTKWTRSKGWLPGLLDALEATGYWFDSVDHLGPAAYGQPPNFTFERKGLAHLLRFTRTGAYTAKQFQTERERIEKMVHAGAQLAVPVEPPAQAGEIAIRILDEKWRPRIFAAATGGLGKTLPWTPDEFSHCGQALGDAHRIGQELFGDLQLASEQELIREAHQTHQLEPECETLWKRIESMGLDLSDSKSFVFGEDVSWLPANGELFIAGMLKAGLGSQELELGRVAQRLLGATQAEAPSLQAFLKGYCSRKDRPAVSLECLLLLMELQSLLRQAGHSA